MSSPRRGRRFPGGSSPLYQSEIARNESWPQEGPGNWTPLAAAAWFGDVALIDALLAHGASIDRLTDASTKHARPVLDSRRPSIGSVVLTRSAPSEREPRRPNVAARSASSASSVRRRKDPRGGPPRRPKPPGAVAVRDAESEAARKKEEARRQEETRQQEQARKPLVDPPSKKKSFVKVGIFERRVPGKSDLCANGELAVFETFQAESAGDVASELRRELQQRCPTGSGKPCADWQTVAKVYREGEFVIVWEGTKEQRSEGCSSRVVGVASGSSHANAERDARRRAGPHAQTSIEPPGSSPEVAKRSGRERKRLRSRAPRTPRARGCRPRTELTPRSATCDRG